MRILFALICCTFLMSCGSDDGGDANPTIECVDIALPAFRIQVTNASTDLPLPGVTITARESNTFEEILMEVSTSPGTYQGVIEREGSYTLVVEIDGFQTVITEAIPVVRLNDGCDTLDTQELSFALEEL
ncbi:carboxypeptidase-like regulatory domain-containing protein [Dokdonia ponticola]|uniref:Carboxypeptidase-like regulatory domain-containing protein n=1 Tax=Dokdonia ponticola TaxID=2041041 RepID=A0ABV9HU91_9FLAO